MQALGLKVPMTRLSTGSLTKEPDICSEKERKHASLLEGFENQVIKKKWALSQ